VCQETADLAEREADEAAAEFFGALARHDGQGAVPIPGVVTADLVLVKLRLGFGRLSVLAVWKHSPIVRRHPATRISSSSAVPAGAQHR
jgi:hypothetical protein